jgi:hypothetical protein
VQILRAHGDAITDKGSSVPTADVPGLQAVLDISPHDAS